MITKFPVGKVLCGGPCKGNIYNWFALDISRMRSRTPRIVLLIWLIPLDGNNAVRSCYFHSVILQS